MRQQEKRVAHEERRPIIHSASDIMGPGLAPHAVEISDWNGEETLFNGIFTSNPNSGTQHSPDPTQHWVGVSYATVDGIGYQQVWNDDDPAVSYHRTFTTTGDSTDFNGWVLLTTGTGGGLTAEQVRDTIAAALVEGTGIDIVYNDAADTITITNTGTGTGVDEFKELTDVTWPTTLKDGAVYVWDDTTGNLVQHMVLGPESDYVAAFEAALT